MNKSESINDIAKALCEAQKEIKSAVKGSENPFYKSKYADLGAVWDACKEALTKNGLSVTQTFEPADSGVTIVTTLLHISGQWIEGRLCLKAVKQDPQAYGALCSYGRRYSLAAIVGVVTEDDDAESATDRKEVKYNSYTIDVKTAEAMQCKADEKQKEDTLPDKTDMAKFLPLMEKEKVRLGEELYSVILGNYGFSDAKEATDKTVASKLYKQMLETKKA